MQYVVTLSKDIDATSVSAADFDNAGTASISIDAVSEPVAGTLQVTVTPTSLGTVILRLPAGASIVDLLGNAAVVPVQDNDSINVINDLFFRDSFE